MSSAGLFSNRGDYFQKLVAFDWMLAILQDSNYTWLEVDSTQYDVDDVVIGKTDGSLICCQCKKNQTNFRSWSLDDLADEVKKTCKQLKNNPTAKIFFYSRDSFGDLAKLKEKTKISVNHERYLESLSSSQKSVDKELSCLLDSSSLNMTTYDFLSHIFFHVTDDYVIMQEKLFNRLKTITNATNVVFDSLWTFLDRTSAREADVALGQHRINKFDVQIVIKKAGGVISPQFDPDEIRSIFSKISCIGRMWACEIGGIHLKRPILDSILTAIGNKAKSILLTGGPGSGKTCIMLDLQRQLEKQAQSDTSIFPLFLQAREFADMPIEAERVAPGLPKTWVEMIARLADDTHVIVVLDSLDVLSIAREHNVLACFLNAINWLSPVSNVTIVTACREFDRHYDSRIAVQKWDHEFSCSCLDMKLEVIPLLNKLKINIDSASDGTKELIRNPRELALFVELALKKNDCHVVTSQALAQHYLDVFIREDPNLGDEAMVRIEKIAAEMFTERQLSIPKQRVSFPLEMERQLYSLNIIQNMENGNITFGHQTLFDILVINGFSRKNCTLLQFINQCPPVPFVRPCIRSFLSQLELRERKEYRKQIRSVLTSNIAFHIRRLVANSFAERIPVEEDWPLILTLKEQHADVFQALYSHAVKPEWLLIWDKYLVPILLVKRDADGINRHLFRLSLWVNQFPKEIFEYCRSLFALDFLDKQQLIWSLTRLLNHAADNSICYAVPLINKILEFPDEKGSQTGTIIARYVSMGALDDTVLWTYISKDISDDTIMSHKFHEKLRCQPYNLDLKNTNFLKCRMFQSTELLDLAISAIEQWNKLAYPGYFLDMTSYEDKHSHHDDCRSKSSERVFFDAIEKAIVKHALTQSAWWAKNLRRICENECSCLRYFGIKACENAPDKNIIAIEYLLLNENNFELSYESGLLLSRSFVYLRDCVQDKILKIILSLQEDELGKLENEEWVLHKRAYLISFIPCYLRSPEAQDILNRYEAIHGKLIALPDLHSWGGVFSPPFSYEVFLSVSDSAVLNLINHYNGYSHRDETLVGGEDEVARELSEAASRQPLRFLNLLSTFWNNIPNKFRDEIIHGIGFYVAYLYGNLQRRKEWVSLEEPESSSFAKKIIDELEEHSGHWHHNRAGASALRTTAYIITDDVTAQRMISLCSKYISCQEKEDVFSSQRDLLNTGINMIKGYIAEALIIFANRLLEKGHLLPVSLKSTLIRFAEIPSKALHAVLLLHLPYLQSKDSDFGWQLFDKIMFDSATLWPHAERCLYYAYHDNYDKMVPLLQTMYEQGEDKDLETWGRISALAAFSSDERQTKLLEDLKNKRCIDAWKGAAQVWTHPHNIQHYSTSCFDGLEQGLSENLPCATAIASKITDLFRKDNVHIKIPQELFNHCFAILESDIETNNHNLFLFCEWLNHISTQDPQYALMAFEAYIHFVEKRNITIEDYENNFAQAITRLFEDAEEHEEIDNGDMLRRVVCIQDKLLARGINSIEEWLKAAERP